MEDRLARSSRKHRETCNNPGERRRRVGFYTGLRLGPGTGSEDRLGFMSGLIWGLGAEVCLERILRVMLGLASVEA